MRLARALFALLVAALPAAAFAQSSVLMGGASTAGHPPMFITGGTGQPIVIDAGPAGGTTTGQGISELNITARCGTPPCIGGGTGPDGTIFTINDAVSTNATGGHTLSFSANALTGGLIEYGAFGTASTLPLVFKINNSTYNFPFTTNGAVGPATTVVNDLACWNNTVGTLLKDCGVQLAIGGTANQIQYNNAGAFGGFTMSGDCTIVVATGVITCTKINGTAVTLGGALTTGGPFITSGASSLTLTTAGVTNVSLPASGTLATLAGSEAFTNHTYNGLTITSSTGVLTITNGKTLTASNTVTFTATDGSTLAIGTGGTLGTAAYTASTAYVPSGVQLTNSLGADVSLNNTANYFDGPSVAQGATGTWFASGTVTVGNTNAASNAQNFCKLWDGTTVIASGATAVTATNGAIPYTISLSGYLASPAGNIRISCRDVTDTTGKIFFNTSSNSKDASLSVFRVQ